MRELAYLGIYLSLPIAIYALVAFALSLRFRSDKFLESAKRASTVVAGLAVLNSVILFLLLALDDFSVSYVAAYSNRALPLLYKLSAFWAGNAGSLLLWQVSLAVMSAVVVNTKEIADRPLIPYVGLVLTANTLFFLILLAIIDNPFALNPLPSADGRGLNPLLQNPGMILHPLTLFLGYVGFTVPYAYAIAALFAGRFSDSYWIRRTRRWTLFSWLFLTLGILLGGLWAYQELGWGGIWMWDPVENASLMPWLVATAFIHSVMMQERKKMLKIWNVALIQLTYLLCIFGTFLVRSGVLTSVHAFGDSSMGAFFLIFLAAGIAVSLYALMSRAHLLKTGGAQFESFLSKESSFLVNNLLFVGLFFATFLGTMFPLLSELVTGTRITVSTPFFNKVNGPIFLALFIVLGVCPLIAWQKSSGRRFMRNFSVPLGATVVTLAILFSAGIRNPVTLVAFPVLSFVFVAHVVDVARGVRARSGMTAEPLLIALFRLIVRNNRRYGGYIVHAGVIVMAAGIIGYSLYTEKVTLTMAFGDTVELGRYEVTYKHIAERSVGDDHIVYATLRIRKDDAPAFELQPEKVFYGYWPDMPTSEVGLYSTLLEDFYVVLSAWDEEGRATFEIKRIPLVSLVWYGGIIMTLGAIFAFWRGRARTAAPAHRRRSERETVGAGR